MSENHISQYHISAVESRLKKMKFSVSLKFGRRLQQDFIIKKFKHHVIWYRIPPLIHRHKTKHKVKFKRVRFGRRNGMIFMKKLKSPVGVTISSEKVSKFRSPTKKCSPIQRQNYMKKLTHEPNLLSNLKLGSRLTLHQVIQVNRKLNKNGKVVDTLTIEMIFVTGSRLNLGRPPTQVPGKGLQGDKYRHSHYQYRKSKGPVSTVYQRSRKKKD